MTSSGGSLAKFVICLVNLLALVIGLVLVLYGCRLQFAPNPETHSELVQVVCDIGAVSVSTLSAFLIGTGLALACVAIFGFTAAIGESICALNCYVWFLVTATGIVIVLDVAVACAFAGDNEAAVDSNRTMFARKARERFTELMSNYTSDNTARKLLDAMQSNLMCCGAMRPSDWHNRILLDPHPHNASAMRIVIGDDLYPASCCDGQRVEQLNKTIAASNTPTTTTRNSGIAKFSAGNAEMCHATDLAYHDGCFSAQQMRRYRIFSQASISLLILALLVLVAMTCCLERDAKLQGSKMLNLQYAAHMQSCRSMNIGRQPLSRITAAARW